MPRQKKTKGHSFEIELYRSPMDGRNRVVMDGEQLGCVTKVEIVGEARKMPQVRLTLLPASVNIKLVNVSDIISKRLKLKTG